MIVGYIGAACFGLVIGWITYRTLRRKSGAAAISDIASVLGAVGGGAVTALFSSATLFGSYAIGLAVGFFGYFAIGLRLNGTDRTDAWMGD